MAGVLNDPGMNPGQGEFFPAISFKEEMRQMEKNNNNNNSSNSWVFDRWPQTKICSAMPLNKKRLTHGTTGIIDS